MMNGLEGIHIASNIPVSIELNDVEMSYACDNNPVSCNASWEYMCAMVYERLGIETIGQIELHEIVIKGVARPFH